MINVTTKELHDFAIFKDVPADQLQWLIDESSHYIIPEGEFLNRPGDPLTGIHLVIKGNLELYRLQNNTKLSVTELPSGSITGTLPFSRAKLTIAFLQCTVDTQFMTFPKDKIRDLIRLHYELTQALVIVMTSRVKEFTELEQQNEKMMALGKLSAGLAHELNNPAAAIVRGSISLKQHLQIIPDTFKRLILMHIEPHEIDILNEKMLTAIRNPNRPVMTMMQRSEKEDDLTDWLEDHEVYDSMDMSENFVEFGITADQLEEIKTLVKCDLAPILTWINNNLTTERMVADIQEASKRIADLVGSVKTFTHMDRGGDKEQVDIHSGIRNTLVMLNYKIKKANIDVVEEFEEGLPAIYGMVGEMNQVWTNLIDNATDALETQNGAKLVIKSWRDKDFVKVAFTDNGPGVPKEIKSRIFDPFFTTKAIGKGTGLGLDVVLRIVKQHHGSVSLESEPGKTEFLVCFPING